MSEFGGSETTLPNQGIDQVFEFFKVGQKTNKQKKKKKKKKKQGNFQ